MKRSETNTKKLIARGS